ncbi:MAG: hypothetical protein QOC68_550 [Solirubrobacteraceae bacterium]|jgi:hypothetical protein|nr:hypothetical protein [Solirubrobacteraceae bacterium]
MSLRTALKLDAIVTGANGAAYLVAAEPLEDLLGPSPVLLRGIGAFLLLFSAAVWTVAARPRVSPSAALVVIALNVLWAADSIAFLATGLSDPTTAGAVWIVLQALVVAGFAALQAVARGAARNRAVAA